MAASGRPFLPRRSSAALCSVASQLSCWKAQPSHTELLKRFQRIFVAGAAYRNARRAWLPRSRAWLELTAADDGASPTSDTIRAISWIVISKALTATLRVI